jgi:hypothetical protein
MVASQVTMPVGIGTQHDFGAAYTEHLLQPPATQDSMSPDPAHEASEGTLDTVNKMTADLRMCKME